MSCFLENHVFFMLRSSVSHPQNLISIGFHWTALSELPQEKSLQPPCLPQVLRLMFWAMEMVVPDTPGFAIDVLGHGDGRSGHNATPTDPDVLPVAPVQCRHKSGGLMFFSMWMVMVVPDYDELIHLPIIVFKSVHRTS